MADVTVLHEHGPNLHLEELLSFLGRSLSKSGHRQARGGGRQESGDDPTLSHSMVLTRCVQVAGNSNFGCMAHARSEAVILRVASQGPSHPVRRLFFQPQPKPRSDSSEFLDLSALSLSPCPPVPPWLLQVNHGGTGGHGGRGRVCFKEWTVSIGRDDGGTTNSSPSCG